MSDAELAQLAMGVGIDESVDDAYVPATAMRTAFNVVFPAHGVTAKRQGLSTLATAPTGARKIVTRGSEVLVSDGQSLWAFVPATSGFVSRGFLSPCMLSRGLLASGNGLASAGTFSPQPVVPLGSQAEDPITKLRVYAWSDSVSVNVSVYDTQTDNYVLTETQLNPNIGGGAGASNTRPRVLISGSVAFILYGNVNASNHLLYRAIDLAHAPATITAEQTLPGTIGVPVVMGEHWDACIAFTGTTPLVFTATAWSGAAVGQAIRFSTFSISGTTLTGVGSTYTMNDPTAFTGISCASAASGDPSQRVAVLVGYYSTVAGVTTCTLTSIQMTVSSGGNPTLTGSGTVAINTYTPLTNAQQAGPFRGIGIVRMGTGTGGSWWGTWTEDFVIGTQLTGPTPTRILPSFRFAFFSNNLGSVQIRGYFVGYQTVSKPAVYSINGTPTAYVLLQFEDGDRIEAAQNPVAGHSADYLNAIQGGAQTLLMVSLGNAIALPSVWSPPVPCAVAAPRFAGDSFAGNADVSVASDGTGLVFVGTEQDAAGATSLSALRANFDDVNLWQTAELGDWSFIGGGLPQIYDGTILCEAGFINQPPTPTLVAGGAGTVIPRISTLQYCVVYVQQDVHGNVHRSPPSNILTVDGTGGYASMTLYVVPYVMTMRQVTQSAAGVVGVNPARIEIYRNNSGAGLTVLQRIASIPNDATSGGGNGYITFVDTVQDAAGVTTQPLLYTTGGVVPSDGPPSLSALEVHADRVFGVSEDGRTAYFTTDLTRGEAPRFTDAFTLTWPTGPITAQWSIESRLHASTADEIFYVYGDGPTPTGAGNDLTPAQEWQNDLGVPDTRCVADAQIGTVLWTSRGLYLEGRDGSFNWIGEKCQRTLGQTYNEVTAIVPLVQDGAVRISCVNTGFTSFGVTLHWDYRRQQFAVHQHQSQSAVQSAAVVSGIWYALVGPNLFDGSFLLVKEDTATNLDGGTWVTMQLATGWAKFGDTQGSARLHRVMVLGLPKTPHWLRVETARDYSSSWDPDAAQWSDATISSLTAEQLRHTPVQQKCMAASVRVTDSPPTSVATGLGTGTQLRAVLLRGRARRGEWKRTSGQQQG